MSAYEERRRLEAENRLRREQAEDARLRLEEQRDALFETFCAAVMAFLTGKAAFVATRGHDDGSVIISFEMPPRAEEPSP